MDTMQFGLRVGVITFVLNAAPVAFADGESQGTESAAKPGALEEIIVTARRVEEPIQSVPLSVAAFDTKALDTANVTNLGDVTRIVPAVRFTSEANLANGTIQIRGLGSPPVGSGGEAVILYTNDVPGSAFAGNEATFDVANVQVLRGPQGTLFGRNTLGGAVLVNLQQPDYHQNGYLTGSYGNYGYVALEGAGNLTLFPDKAALRFGAQIHRRDGYTNVVGTPSLAGKKMDDLHTDDYRVSLLLDPTAELHNVLVLNYLTEDDRGSPSIALPLDSSGSPVIPASTDIRTVDFGPNKYVRINRKQTSVFNTTTFKFSDAVTLKNILGYRNDYDFLGSDTDGTALQLFDIVSLGRDRQWTDEVQLLGSAFNDRVNWLVGGFYLDDVPLGKGGVLLHSSINPFDPSTFFTDRSQSYTSTRSRALFTNVGLKLTHRLKLNAGFRYTWDEQKVCTTGTIPGPDSITPDDLTNPEQCAATVAAAAGSLGGVGILRQKGNAPTWSFGPDYQATDDLFLYAVTRRGYRSGGLNTVVFNTPCTTGGPSFIVGGSCVPFDGFLGTSPVAVDLRPFQRVKEEYLTDVEIGMRSDWRFGGWNQRLNLTAWRYVYTNVVQLLQLGFPTVLPPQGDLTIGDPGNPPFGALAVNAAEVTAEGVELELTLKPSDRFIFMLNAAYTNQAVTKPAVSPVPGVTFQATNLPTPRWATTAAVRYALPFRPLDGELAFDFDYFYTARYEAQSEPMPGYDVSNLRLEWNDIRKSNLSASFWMRNVFDKKYVLAPVFASSGVFNVGEPRLFGAEFTYRFH